MTKSFKVLALSVVVLTAIFFACNKAEDTIATTASDAVDQELYSVQERGGLGRFGCYELVFPVSFTLPDSSVVTVNSYQEIVDALQAYYEANGTGSGNGHGHGHGHGGAFRPRLDFVYPISVVSEDGEVITVNNQDELRALRAECAGSFGHHGPAGHCQQGLSCFEIVFPITLEFPDSTTASAGSRQELHQLIRDWRQANPGVQGRPHIVFPITVQMTADSSLVTVNSRDELRALKESCE